MQLTHRKLMLLLFALFLLPALMVGCQSKTAIPPVSASETKTNTATPAVENKIQSSPQTTQTTQTTNSGTNGTAIHTPPTAKSPEYQTGDDAQVFGYIELSPTVFVQPDNDLKIQITNGTYNPQTGALLSYKLMLTSPSGDVNEFLFKDIALNSKTGKVDHYVVSTGGQDIQSPGAEEFDAKKQELGQMIAFSLAHMLGNEPLPMVSVPCQGDSNVKYGQSPEGFRQVLVHEIKCGERKYTMTYSDYSYDMQLGALSGYKVVVGIKP